MARLIHFARAMGDQIFVEGIKFHGFHGLTKLERQVGVRLSVDVTLELDLETSGRSDRMADTLDYGAVHKTVIEVGRGRSYKLLETFVRTLLDELLARFEAERVTVRVRKETPVLDGIVDAVGVQMTRTRAGRAS
ncbi:MAG TPA: dihydroneopterin aldolase [Candidatus Sulfotelmatobacter sp.]|nr:dihydroneopterin aldolase [Candidatus Sulfotelmatobacter sp.]